LNEVRRGLSVGMNLLFLTPTAAGAGRYATELLPALLEAEPDIRLTGFVGADAPAGLFEHEWSRRISWTRYPTQTRLKTHIPAQMTAVPLAAARRKLDLLHSPANLGPLYTPGVAHVVTLLDVIWKHQKDAWEQGVVARGFGALSRLVARNADRVIAISESARRDIVETLDLDADKVDVAPLGVRGPDRPLPDAGDVRKRLDLGDRPVVLAVAQKRPYKNLESLVRALQHLEAVALVLVGSSTPHEQELRELAAELGVTTRVRFLDWVPDDELEQLYRAASCFVLPSLIEGFGLPVLEAMARDVPVACSNRPALPEVVGDAALLFDPEDQAEVTAAIRRLIEDRALANRLVERGRGRVELFTWRRTAEATLASYRRAAGASAASARS